jgi:PhzF family phenazine biosynthesis protein
MLLVVSRRSRRQALAPASSRRRTPAACIQLLLAACQTAGVTWRPFAQVDVFTETAYLGNPVAVVLDAEGLTAEEMQRIAHWTNLSETTFVLPPTIPAADYKVRIFTTSTELPFAGHPTLGTCHAWLQHPSTHHEGTVVVQECPAGLVRIRSAPYGLAFLAPPMIKEGPLDEETVGHLAGALGLGRSEVLAARWADNGPGWAGLLLRDADTVLGLRTGAVDHPVGVIGPYPAGSPCAFEVRAFFPANGSTVEDPVTGSLNASLAQWLTRSGCAHPPYVVSQGTAVGAVGRVHIELDSDGAIWVGGGTVTAVVGRVDA